MLVCLDQRTGTGCGAENQNGAAFCKQCGRSLRLAPVLHDPGATVGNYRVIRLIKYGSFGAVYEAEVQQDVLQLQLQAGRHVALKESFDPTSVTSFRNEFLVLQKLHHDNLPSYYDLFEEQGNGYLVMEFVVGQDLEEILIKRQTTLPETVVLGFALQLCDALNYLHTQSVSIIHRDIKPANIRLTPEGQIKLVDFGLLKQGVGPTRSTIRGVGTPEYAPVEQYGGGQSTDARSDIYSLGVTLYQLLTGHLPPDAMTRIAVTPDPILSPQNYNPTLSDQLSDAIMGSLGLKKEDRYADVMEFARVLRGQQAISIHRTPTLQRYSSLSQAQNAPTRAATPVSPAVPAAPPVKGGQGRIWWLPILLIACIITVGGIWLANLQRIQPQTPSVTIHSNTQNQVAATGPSGNGASTPTHSPQINGGTQTPQQVQRGPLPSEMFINITTAPPGRIGEWTWLEIRVENASASSAKLISIRIDQNYFASYRLESVEPALVTDKIEADGKRHLNFKELPGKSAAVYRLNMVRTGAAFPGNVMLEVYTQDTGVFAQPLPNPLPFVDTPTPIPTATATATPIPSPTPTRIPSPTPTPIPTPTPVAHAFTSGMPAEQAIRNYYGYLQQKQYDQAWLLLSKEFRTDVHRNSFADYQRAWEGTGPAVVVEVTDDNEMDTQATVTLRLRYVKSKKDLLLRYIFIRDLRDGSQVFGYWSLLRVIDVTP